MATATTKKQELTPITSAQVVPDFLKELMDTDASLIGMGLSTDAADNLVPIVKLLQPLSPELDRSDSRYVEGAVAGDILLPNAPHPLLSSAEGLPFLPSYQWHDYVEWIPREQGGGIVGRSKTRPPEARRVIDPKRPKAQKWVMPSGNESSETISFAGFAVTQDGHLPFVLPFKSSGLSVARAWMTAMRYKKDEQGRETPIFGQVWKLSTVQQKNTMGSWYVMQPRFERFVTSVDELRLAMELHKSFADGSKQADMSQDDSGASSGNEEEVPF